ncbi:hypothetical protein K440DRAFT_653172 [Wilcoxina mikolae CBS 423.85]|nr:hypothetical protein K440DRAFT_653172 [Wilcoxina mikolae CBS 423.85]
MANKSSKSLARTNLATLQRTHLTTLSLHAIFILYRLFFRRGSITKYILLSLPSLLIEFYLDKLGRPRYHASGELRSPGEDLAAAGVTEYLWDIVYVTWIVLGLVGVLGEWAWWAGLIVPAYAAFLAWGLWKRMNGGSVPGMPEEQGEEGKSRRQAKMEGRGGQKVRYR